ncbi:MAG TPA: NHL repeat-containing protein, partial [Roseiflexaceae bacterium]|nr:NHL repeat-containing protein [Roseiflexaceae bacterium]
MTRPDILRRTPLVLIATVLGVALLLPLAVAAFGNGQPASLVLGHDDYTTSDSLTWRKLKGPADVVVDPVTGKVFVSDSQNHRVLRFSAESAFESNLPAEAVLGQPTRSSIAPGTTAARMEWPRGLLVDGEGRLWVADAGNSRVLRFDNAASKPTGAPADGVLGQPDFTSDAWAATAQRLYAPHGLAMDSSGQLWVADAGNHRVLRFDNAAGKPNGAAADAVLGQPGFTSATSGWTAQSMNQPQAVAVDTAGRLWVGDTNNHRVLRFDAVASKPNGAPADGLLGQTDYVPVTFPYQPIDRRVIPFDLQADSAGRLWVAEIGDRVLRFDNAASKPNGTPADGVLGQATLNDHAYPWPAQDRMNNPQGIALDMAGRLWVVDTGNNRVLRFDNVAAKASGAPADGLLGPDNFDGTLNPTDRHFSVPVGVAVDPVSGKLFVADGFHNRVLRFGRVDSLISGTAAEAVLGQPDFTRSDPRAGSEGMSVPAGLAFDSSGRLWVADTRNSRVLRFDNAASKPNGAAADGVLGQPNFASHDRATTQQGMSMPFDVAVDQTGRLWVADGYNKRVLRFDNAANKPDGALADGVLGQLDFESRVIATTQQSVGEPEGVTVDNNGRLWVSDGTNGRVL